MIQYTQLNWRAIISTHTFQSYTFTENSDSFRKYRQKTAEFKMWNRIWNSSECVKRRWNYMCVCMFGYDVVHVNVLAISHIAYTIEEPCFALSLSTRQLTLQNAHNIDTVFMYVHKYMNCNNSEYRAILKQFHISVIRLTQPEWGEGGGLFWSKWQTLFKHSYWFELSIDVIGEGVCRC